MRKLNLILKDSVILVFAFYILSSCALNKNYIYLNDTKTFNSSDSTLDYTSILKPDDFLGINISSIDLEAVQPFNLPIVSYTSNGQSIGTPTLQGLLIDSKGFIEYPILGKIKVGGLTKIEATEYLREKLKNYIKDPIVNIRILNFKITVIGDVKNPGSFTIPNERVTILEALGMAGDLNITGLRKNVLVIREKDGKKVGIRVDLTSSDLVKSPVYYLNQNDVIYVEQNKTKVNSARNSGNTGIIITALSVLINSIYLITLISKSIK